MTLEKAMKELRELAMWPYEVRSFEKQIISTKILDLRPFLI